MQCLLHRYLYYVLHRPFLTDLEYDRLEEAIRKFEKKHGIKHPRSPTVVPGSTLASDYPRSIEVICRRYYPEHQETPKRQKPLIF